MFFSPLFFFFFGRNYSSVVHFAYSAQTRILKSHRARETKYIHKRITHSQNGTRRSRVQGETGRASGEVRLLCAFTRRALVFEGGFRATILIRFHFFLLLALGETKSQLAFNDFSRCGAWRVFDFVFESERETRTGRGVRECIFAREK